MSLALGTHWWARSLELEAAAGQWILSGAPELPAPPSELILAVFENGTLVEVFIYFFFK